MQDPQDIEAFPFGLGFGLHHVAGIDPVPAPTGAVGGPVGKGKELDCQTPVSFISPEDESRALLRIGGLAVTAKVLSELLRKKESHGALQKGSLRYFSPESGKRTTITAS